MNMMLCYAMNHKSFSPKNDLKGCLNEHLDCCTCLNDYYANANYMISNYWIVKSTCIFLLDYLSSFRFRKIFCFKTLWRIDCFNECVNSFIAWFLLAQYVTQAWYRMTLDFYYFTFNIIKPSSVGSHFKAYFFFLYPLD